MSLWRIWIAMALLLLVPGMASAQHADPTGPQSSRVVLLSTTNGLSAATFNLPGPTRSIHFNPAQSNSWARVDHVGMLHYVPPGAGSEITYSFAPYFEGYSAESPSGNKLFVPEVRWSPRGDMLAFRIENAAIADASSGVWFWQPARELATDPSYQILRNCPPFCELAGASAGQNWRAIDLKWSLDNRHILVTLELPEQNRRALTVRTADRDPQTQQAGTAPTLLEYEYGHWSLDPDRIIVSGREAGGRVVFGTIGRDGTRIVLIDAGAIGMRWVQDAVQLNDGRIVMLGSTSGPNSPMLLVDEQGQTIAGPIGSAAPDWVSWSPDRSAVWLRTGDEHFVVRMDGTITNITQLMSGSLGAWVQGGFPSGASPQTLPESAQGTATGSVLAVDEITVGMLLQVIVPDLIIYYEPANDALAITNVPAGTEIIITGGPLSEGDQTWWRIQTVNFSGWVKAAQDGSPTLGSISGGG